MPSRESDEERRARESRELVEAVFGPAVRIAAHLVMAKPPQFFASALSKRNDDTESD
jgi:hypothetical protein